MAKPLVVPSQIRLMSVNNNWRLIDAQSRDGGIAAFVVGPDEGSETVGDDVLAFGSPDELLAATGGCHVEGDGTAVSVRLDGICIGPDGAPVPRWRIGSGS